MVFTSSRSGGVGGGDIYETGRAAPADTWSAPTTSSINSIADASAPWLSADARTLYFGTTRTGGQGLQDLWMAIRPTPGDPWTTPTPVTELNGVDNDSDPWLSPDQRTIFYSRQSGSMRRIVRSTR